MRLHPSFLLAALLASATALADDGPIHAHDTMHPAAREPGPALPAATPAHAFQQRMDRAMARMHAGMETAPRTGDPDRDFVTQMIPHHQGAIDMAQALLLSGRDPGLQRLAKEILTDQQSEIALMRAWLDRHPTLAKENR